MIRKLILGVLVLGLTAGVAPADEMTLDELLGNYYEAIGGLDAFKAIDSMKANGNMSMGGGMEAPFQILFARPMRLRLEFTVQGMTGIQAFDGEKGWMLMPFMGQTDPEEMPAEMLRDMKDQADFEGPLISYEEKGHAVELVGSEEVEGTDTYHVKVTLDTGQVQNYYLDAENFVPIRVTGKREMMGNEVEFETLMSDYKEVAGVMMPHSIESKVPGSPQSQVITLNDVDVNVEVAEDAFAMPEKAAAPAE